MRKVLVLIILAILVIPINIFASTTSQYNIVGIGDSIMYGYTVNKGDEFLNLVSTEIQKNLGPNVKVNSKNLAVNGLDSSGLLESLKTDRTLIKYIKNSDLIEISIGGNDTLLPITRFVVNQMDIVIPPTDTDIFSILQGHTKELLALDYTKVEPSMIKAKDNFVTTTWPKIIERIKKLNPSAKIIVINTFNPYKSLTPLIKLADCDLINTIDIVNDGINQKISSYASGRYEYVDISKSFDSLAGLFLTNFSQMDPHPNVVGHQLIYALHRDALEKYKLINDTYLKDPKVSLPFVGKLTLGDISSILKDLRISLQNFNLKNYAILTKNINYKDIAQVLINHIKWLWA